ncbi:MAG: glycosyltransferase [Clostridium sp.]|nr:glycosyltransferase [Clostridium sp.]
MKEPLISIIMPSYNTKVEFLKDAVNSVLGQTYANFELIIIDDGSKDSVAEVLSDINDSRIKVLVNPSNKGLPYTLNRGISEAAGKYIFRMDSDDKCKSERIEKQVVFFEQHPDIDVVATFAKAFGNYEGTYQCATVDSEIKAELLWKNPIIHPTVALRTQTVHLKNINYSDKLTSEDYNLWCLLAFKKDCKFAVIPEELLNYRIHSGQITQTKRENLKCSERKILKRSFRSLAIKLDEQNLDMYCKMRDGCGMTRMEFSGTVNVMKIIMNQVPTTISIEELRTIYRKEIVKYCVIHKKLAWLVNLIKI